MNQYPAGMLCDGAEFFRDKINMDLAYGVTSSRVMRINDLPDQIKIDIDKDIKAHPLKDDKLTELGFTDLDSRREKYIACVFGKFDTNPDYVNGTFFHNEYVPCLLRSTCSGSGILCNPLTVGPDNKILTKREIQVLILIGQCRLNKEIAAELKISESTAKIHITNIQTKAGLDNKMDLVKLAYQNDLI